MPNTNIETGSVLDPDNSRFVGCGVFHVSFCVVLMFCGLLILTGIGKISESRSAGLIPNAFKPHLPNWLGALSSKHAGVFDLTIAMLTLLSSVRYSLLILGWASSVFILFHLFSRWFKIEIPCNCLGAIASGVGMETHVATMLSTVMSVAMLIASTILYVKCASVPWKTIRAYNYFGFLLRSRTIATVIVVLVNVAVSSKAATPFYVEGKTTRSSIFQTRGTNLTDVYSFSMYVSNHVWKVRLTELTSPPIGKRIAYREIGNDGNCTYTIRALKEQVESQAGNPGQRVRLNSSTGEIEQGQVPAVDGCEHLSIIWLAYAASSHLRTNVSGQLTPLFVAAGNSDVLRHVGFTQRSNWSLETESPNCPKWVTFHSDGNIYSWSDRADAWVIPPTKTPHSLPYNGGFTNMHYYAEQFTNCNGIRLPSSCNLFVYTPKIGGTNSGQLHAVQILSLKMEKCQVGLISPTSYVPGHPDGLCYVTDMRFIKEQKVVFGFNYLQTNGWLTLEEAARLGGYKQQLRAQVEQASFVEGRTAWTRRTVVISSTCLVGVTFIFFVLLWREMQKQKAKTK